MQKVIPARLMSSEERDSFLAWVNGLFISPEDKKQLLRLWADRVHIPVTHDMLIRAGIEWR